MADFMQQMSFPGYFQQQSQNHHLQNTEPNMYNSSAYSSNSSDTTATQDEALKLPSIAAKPEAPPPPPVVICPTEVDSVAITLEKNQQCACKDCGKLFNSVWYLKQHAVKHSNDRPFKCKFCFKTYKFRSNLYQHKCPDRQRSSQAGRRLMRGSLMVSPNSRKVAEQPSVAAAKPPTNAVEETQQIALTSDNEENDVPIHLGLHIRVENANLWTPPEPCQIVVDPPAEPPNCIRDQQLSREEIDSYISQNKSKLYTCRKCRLMLPSTEMMMRHAGLHDYEDMYCYNCAACPEMFSSDNDLRAHEQHHDSIGPIFTCNMCCASFRTNLQLKRHYNRCSACVQSSFFMEKPDFTLNTASPLDPFSFITSAGDKLLTPSVEELANAGPDSGIGSEASPHSFHEAQNSPDTAPLPSEEELEEALFGKKQKDDDTDSGFRSRLNSMTQSCSPGSSSHMSNSEHGSPMRKLSQTAEQIDFFAVSTVEDLGTGYGSGQAYGHMMADSFELENGKTAGLVSKTGNPCEDRTKLDGAATLVSVNSTQTGHFQCAKFNQCAPCESPHPTTRSGRVFTERTRKQKCYK